MTFCDLLDASLLILSMAWLVTFTERAHSRLIQFVFEPGSFSEKWLSSQSVPSLHCHMGFFFFWCKTLHLCLEIFLFPFHHFLGSSTVLQCISSSSHLGIFIKLVEGTGSLLIDAVNKAAECYRSCY